MADKKISELNVVSLPLSGTEEIPIVQNGETKKVLSSDFLDASIVKRIFNFSNNGFRVYNNSLSVGVKNFYSVGANASGNVNMNFNTNQTDANLLNIANGVNQMLVAPYNCKVKNIAFNGAVIQECAIVSAEGDINDRLIYNTTNSYDRDIATSDVINKGEFIGLFMKLTENQTQQYRSTYLMVDFEEI